MRKRGLEKADAGIHDGENIVSDDPDSAEAAAAEGVTGWMLSNFI